MLWADYNILLVLVKLKNLNALPRFQFLTIHFVKQSFCPKLVFVKVLPAHVLQSIYMRGNVFFHYNHFCS